VTFVTRLRSRQLPSETARQLPDLSTIIRVEPSSTDDSRLQGAPPLNDMIGLAQFGLLIDLAGTWMGKGFNLVSLPLAPSVRGTDSDKKFVPKIGTTREVLAIAPLGSPVPNRGFVQEDISLFGLTYLQVVTDATSSEARHFETGLWLNVPNTTPPSVVRQGVIPHGDSLLARGTVTQSAGAPTIPVISSRPIDAQSGQPITGDTYLAPFRALTLPQEIPPLPPGSIDDPNEVLRQALPSPPDVKETITIDINTGVDGAGILNIPFVRDNAEARQMTAQFWIETVVRGDQTPFVQLQYSQTVMLRFDGVDWPHISVATLIRQ
jgi:hypothetical protein